MCVVRSARRQVAEGHAVFDSLPFDDGVDLVCRDILEGFNLPGWPANLNQIDPGRRAQTEVQTKIILRKITPAAADFVELGHRSRVNRHARTNRSPVTLRSHQME